MARRLFSVLLCLPLAVPAAAHQGHGQRATPKKTGPAAVRLSPSECTLDPRPPASAAEPKTAALPQASIPAEVRAEAASPHDHHHHHEEDDHHRDAPRPEGPQEPEEKVSFVQRAGRALARASGAAALWSLARYPAAERGVDELLDRSLPSERRARAAMTLRRYGGAESRKALELAARDENGAVALAARQALQAHRWEAPPEPAASYRPRDDEFQTARRPVHEGALKRVVAVSALFTIVEAAGGYYTGSVSLLADAMHLFVDMIINVGALAAIWAAKRPPTLERSFGLLKMEPVVGLISSLLIAGLALYTGYEAIGKFFNPSEIPGLMTMILATAGLAANAVSTVLLYRFRDDSLSMKGAFLHAATDALGSIGIIIAGGLIMAFGWHWADPLVTLLIVALILRVSWELGQRSWNMVTDATPEGFDPNELETALLAVPGVASVADMHVWSLNSFERSAALSLKVTPDADRDAVVKAAKALLDKRGVKHATVETKAR